MWHVWELSGCLVWGCIISSVLWFNCVSLAASLNITWPLIYSVFSANTLYLWNIELVLGPTIWSSFSLLWFYLLYFPFRDTAHASRTGLDVDGSIISHISSVWSRDPNPSSLQDWVIWTLLSANMECTAIEAVWPHFPWLSWSSLFPPIIEVRLAYSWIDWFSCSATSGSLLFGGFLYVWNLSAWYMVGGGGWYTPSTPQGCWTCLLTFLWPFRPHLCKRPQSPSCYSWYQSGRGKMNVSGPSKEIYFLIPEFLHLMPWIPLVPLLQNINEYSSIVSATIVLFSSAWNLLLKQTVFV